MKSGVVVSLGVALLTGAQLLRTPAAEMRGPPLHEAPFAPSTTGTRMLSIGYNELVADLLFFRLVGYFGSLKQTADGVASLVEAIAVADPYFRKIYVWGSQAMVFGVNKGVGRDHFFRAIAVLERGMKHFPNDYELPRMAGEIYLLDLTTKDPVERRAWDVAGTALLEKAVRMPGAPADLGDWIAHLRTKLGQLERAKSELRELILITDDKKARQVLLDKLAELTGEESTDIASEVLEERRKFDEAWQREWSLVPPSMFVLLGTRSRPGFDLTDLATGGHDLIDLGTEPLEPLGP